MKHLARLLRSRAIAPQTYAEGLSALGEIPPTPAPRQRREPPTPVPLLVHPEGYCRICLTCHDKATTRPPRDVIAPAQWREKGESLYMPMEHAAYLAKPDYKATKKDLTPSNAPRHDDPLTRHQLSYLNGGGGSGTTTRAIELFGTRNPLVFTPTHILAKEMRARGSNPKLTTVSSDTLALNLLEQPKKISSFSRASLNTSGRP